MVSIETPGVLPIASSNIDVWLTIRIITYPREGPGNTPILKVEHEVLHFEGGPTELVKGVSIVGVFPSEHAAMAYIASCERDGIITYDETPPPADGGLPEDQRQLVRVFRMVKELHRRGYQQLRIVPGMSGSGMSYRCSVTPAANVPIDHGAMGVDHELVAAHTSANGDRLFEWDDAPDCSIGELARMFIRRFPTIAKLGRALDLDYVAWFDTALTFAERGEFPIAYDGGYFSEPNPNPKQTRMPTTAGYESALLLPPAGLNPERCFRS